MNEKKLNEKESLELIARMIENTKQNLQPKGTNPFVIWGVSTLVASVLVELLSYIVQSPYIGFGYFIIPIMGNIWIKLSTYQQKVTTHIDKMLKSVWMVCGIFCTIIPLITVILVVLPFEWHIPIHNLFANIPFIELLIVAIGISTTGVIIESKLIKTIGFVSIIFAFSTFLRVPHITTYTFSLWSIICLIIPGIIISHRTKKEIQCLKS